MKKILNNFPITFLAVFFIFFTGCGIFDSVPSGEAPTGDIVSNSANGKVFASQDEAVNYFVTLLAIESMEKQLTGRSIFISGAEKKSAEELKLLRKFSVELFPLVNWFISSENSASYLLESSLSSDDGKKIWQLELKNRKTGQLLWSDSVSFITPAPTNN